MDGRPLGGHGPLAQRQPPPASQCVVDAGAEAVVRPGRALDRRWTVGRSRKELQGLPEDMRLLVNVPVSVSGDSQPSFVPVAVVDGGFTVTRLGAAPEDQILPAFNIELHLDPGLIYVRPCEHD